MAANDERSDREGQGGANRRASWRGSASATAAATAGYRWRDAGEKTNREIAQKNLRRRLKLIALSSIVFGLCGAFAWYWLMRPRATPLLAVTLTQYAAPLAPNSFAVEDARRFADAAKAAAGGSGMLAVKLAPSTLDGTDDDPLAWNDKPADALVKHIGEWLEGVTAGGPGRGLFGYGGTVIVYLSGHGIVDEQGRACVIPADSESRGVAGEPPYTNSQRWLPVADLVAQLDKTRPDVKKLLVLDCNRLGSQWAIGLLYNGFGDALSAALGNARSVAILNAAGPGQMAWPAPELQGTPLAFYLAQALLGDTAADENHNGRISVQEVARFVGSRVSNWVRASRYDDQHPLLLPADADFDVVYKDVGVTDVVQPPSNEKIEAELNELQPLLNQLDELWLEHAAMQESAEVEMPAVWSEHGLDWHRFQQELVRCGSLMLAGRGYRDECQASLAQLKSLAKALGERRLAALPVHSLPLAQRWQKLASESSLHDEAADYLRGEKKKPSSKLRDDYFLRADGAWQWIIQGRTLAGQGGREAARRAIEFAGSPGANKAELVEFHLLKLVAGDAPDSTFDQFDKQLLPVLRLRQTAEDAAAPQDLRVHYAIRRSLDAADANLRRLENALFLNDDAWKKVEPALLREQEYQSAAREGDRLAEILFKRDRAWAELPYLAEWSLRRPQTPDDRAPQPADKIAQVIRQLQSLDVRLHAFLDRAGDAKAGALREETLEELQLDSDKIERWRSGVRMNLQDEVDRAVVRARDEVTLRQTTTLLANPLVSGRKRIALRKQFLDALQKPAATAGAAPSALPPAAIDEEAYLTQLSTGEHPATALVGATSDAQPAKPGGKPAPDAPWLRLARQGGLVRTALRDFFSAPAATADDDEGHRAPARAVYSAAERRMRAAAPLLASAGVGANDPIDRLARFDLNEFLAWRGERALADFWGSHGEGGSTRPYFAGAFDELREAARKLSVADAVAGGDMQARWAPLKEKQQQLLAAAEQSGIAGGGSDVARAPGMTFQRKVPLKLAADLPAGEAALFVLDAEQNAAPVRLLSSDSRDFQPRLPLATVVKPAAAGEVALEIRRGKTGDDSAEAQTWTAVWFYRGHRKSQTFLVVPQREGLKVVYQRRATPVDTTVTVTGDDLKEASIVFILDCSGSMGYLPDRDVEAGPGQPRRIDMAHTALGNIIEDLTRMQRLRVGLWLYGHRLGRNVAGGPVVASPDWPPPPAAMRIGNDVDKVLPLVTLNDAVKREFLDRLSRAKPRGETPLYLSIVEAMKPFHWPAGSGARHLVVITDGKNQVTEQGPVVVGSQVVQALQADRRNRGQQAVKLHVLDCTRGQSDELRKLVTANGLGDYVAVDQWQKLERTLKDALGLAEYELQNVRDGRTLPPQPFGSPIVVPGPFESNLAREYQVRVVDRPGLTAKVKLEGEEALRLLVSRREAREQLIFERYEPQGVSLADRAVLRGLANVLPAGTGDDEMRPAGFDIAAYPPQWEGGAAKGKRPVRFALSIQDGGDPPGFSPRPAEAWIEIAPRADNETSSPYPFYDRLFEEERPVPVLLCQAPEWPVAAREAEIRLWFKLEPTRPTKELVIGKIETPADETQELPLPGMPAIRLGVQTADEGDGGRLTVTEEHPPGDAPPPWLRIETIEPPDRVVRTFSYGGRSATHEFYFRGRPRSFLINDRLLITTQTDLRREAIVIEKTPLRVTME